MKIFYNVVFCIFNKRREEMANPNQQVILTSANEPKKGFYAKLGPIGATILFMVVIMSFIIASNEFHMYYTKRNIPIIREAALAAQELGSAKAAAAVQQQQVSTAAEEPSGPVDADMFDCKTEKLKKDGFASASVQKIGKSGLHFKSGCALVQVGLVTSLRGSGQYYFGKQTGSGYQGIGTFGMDDDKSRTDDQIIRQLNLWGGSEVEVVIGNGGTATIK